MIDPDPLTLRVDDPDPLMLSLPEGELDTLSVPDVLTDPVREIDGLLLWDLLDDLEAKPD